MTEAQPQYLPMEIRSVDLAGRQLVGVVAPYDETSFVVPDPRGERIKRGAFTKSINDRGGRIFLNLEHDDARRVAKAIRFEDGDDGLLGQFQIRASTLGDQTLAEIDEGFWPFMSVGFRAIQQRRGADGAREVSEAYLGHVALVAEPAYAGAQVLAVRAASREDVLAGFGARPTVDLSPLPNWR